MVKSKNHQIYPELSRDGLVHPQPIKIRRVAQVDNVPDALVAAQQNAKANNCQSLKPQPGSKNG